MKYLNLPKFSNVSPLFLDLHWLPEVALIRFKMMVLAYKAVNGTAPAYLQSLVKPHPSAGALRSTSSAGRLVPPSQRASKSRSSKSHLFSVLERQWWNEIPADARIAEPLTSFRKRLKPHLFRDLLDCIATPSHHSYLLYVVALNVRTCMSYLVKVLSCVLSYPSYLCCVWGMG